MKYNSIYTEQAVQYIIDHYGKDKTSEQIAAHIGVGKHGLKNKVCDLRKEGIQVTEYRPRYPIGTITERTENGKTFQCIKTEGGWRRVKSPKIPKAPRAKKERVKQVRITARPAKGKAPTDKRKPDYQAQGQVRIRPVDLVNNHFVNTKRGTWVLKPRNIAI